MTASPRKELYGGVDLPKTTSVLRTTPRAQFGTAAVKTPARRTPRRTPASASASASSARAERGALTREVPTREGPSSRGDVATPDGGAKGAPPAAANVNANAKANAGSSATRSRGIEYNAGAPESAVENVIDKKGGQTYAKGRLLGKGGFAKCYKFRHVTSKHVCAGKCVEKASLKKERARRKLLSEIKIHRSLSHTNVVRFEHFFEDKHYVYILLEYCNNQTLMELVKRKRRLSESHTRTIMLQLLDGVEYLHSVNVIHRDLKLGNIFLTDGLNVRIGDFGLAARLEHKEEKKKTMCGTPNYLAPEILDGTLGHSFEVDIWSLGVILYTLLVGKPPFETKNVKQTYKRIQANLYVFPREIPLSAEAVDLVRIILNKDPKMRPSLKAIRAHPFFTCVHPPAERRRDDVASPSTRTFADKENAAASGNHGARPRASPKIKSRHQLERERAAERGQWLRQSQNPQHAQQADVRRLAAASPKVPSPSPRSSRRSSEASPMSLASPTTPKVPARSPARSPAEGAPLVVQKWVDYTSKYGLGYLLQGGLVGVYFNDATKLIVAPNRYEFQYYERGAQDFARHTLTRYPKELHKKVTLVKHFRNYLEKEPSGDPEATEAAAATMAAAEAMAASAGGRSPVSPEHFEDASVPLPFVKKWVRTRHAIFFRLSNRTVQVAFFDDTQILLSAQAKRLTYFDKSRQAQTLPIEEAKMDAEISKRLRYTKDVLHKLIAGSSPSPTR